MAITHKDINLLSQKATIAGTEKIPVSDTEYVTTTQIASLGGGGTVGTLNTTATTAQSTNASESLSGSVTLHKIAKTGTYSDLIGTPTVDSASSLTSTNALQNSTIRKNFLYTPIRTITVDSGHKMNASGERVTASDFEIWTISVSAGYTYALWTRMKLTGGSNLYMAIWTDGNDAVVKTEYYYTNGSGTVYYDNVLLTVPEGATKLNINLLSSYAVDANIQLFSSYPYGGGLVKTLSASSSNEQFPTAKCVYDALGEKQKAITISSSEPTSGDGSDGDIWIVI